MYSSPLYVVSIHAPARGATSPRHNPPFQFDGFNPRSRTGSDVDRWAMPMVRRMFQSTLPHGERPPGRRPASMLRACFNPRSRTGSDAPTLLREACEMIVSIHAPARGATCTREVTPSGQVMVSIHAPARGATLLAHNAASRMDQFQSTLPHGERHIFLPCICNNLLVSIHAPARGATTSPLQAAFLGGVSIHAPARGATSSLRAAIWSDDVSIHAPARGAT